MVTIPSVQDVAVPPSWDLGEFRLRPLRLTDAPAFHAYLAEPRVIEHTSFPELALAAVEAMISRQLQGYADATSCRWALADADDRLIGTCGFTNWSLPHAHAELAYDLAPAFWGRGLMRAAAEQVLSWAFDTAGFNRVHSFVMTSNAPSIGLLERLGFQREGTLWQYRNARGVARDVHVYARLRAAKEPPMAQTKTRPTGASVEAYLASRASPEQLADCKAIMAICQRVTKQQPRMWGPSIVGYGSYSYRYESGHSGESCLAGFAVRGKELVVYLLAESPEQVARLSRLGKHKMGKSCLYFKRLADLDVEVLEALVAESVAEVRRRYPDPRDA